MYGYTEPFGFMTVLETQDFPSIAAELQTPWEEVTQRKVDWWVPCSLLPSDLTFQICRKVVPPILDLGTKNAVIGL